MQNDFLDDDKGNEPIDYGLLDYPAPWAENESISVLATEAEARSIMEQVGLTIDQWILKNQESIQFFEDVSAKIELDGPPPIGIHLLMGDNAKDKLENYVRNLKEKRTSVAMGMARRRRRRGQI